MKLVTVGVCEWTVTQVKEQRISEHAKLKGNTNVVCTFTEEAERHCKGGQVCVCVCVCVHAATAACRLYFVWLCAEVCSSAWGAHMNSDSRFGACHLTCWGCWLDRHITGQAAASAGATTVPAPAAPAAFLERG
jgi:hypothetical protein